MELEFKRLSESEFNGLDVPVVFDYKEYSRAFAAIYDGRAKCKFSWRSDTINPSLGKIEDDIFALGVDQSFAIIDSRYGGVLCNIELFYLLFSIEIIDKFIYVICEMEIIVLDKEKYNIVKQIALPDSFDSFQSSNGRVVIHCVDGSAIYV